MISAIAYLYISQRWTMDKKDLKSTSTLGAPEFHMDAVDKRRLEGLPWSVSLEEWPEHGVVPLSIRRGESRHPVLFVEREGVRYAIKETTPHMAEREVRNLREIELRGIPALSPVGTVIVPAPPVVIDENGPGGHPQYMSGDRGYTITRLAPRVVPQALLYQLPFTTRTKQRLWSAIAVLMIELHEHGVYWGDPSLANILIRIDGRRILAIMADAETAELFPGPVSEGLREQDIASFEESLIWQGEDIRQARGLPEGKELVGEKDFRYFIRRYRLLRREHAHLAKSSSFLTLSQLQNMLESLGRVGVSLLNMGGHTLSDFVTVLPGWYVKRIHKLLGIRVPRIYAHRFYNMILEHQAMMSEREDRDVSIEEAAKDWYTHYHLPAILLLRQFLTSGQDPLQAYFSVMRFRRKLSRKEGHEIPMDEAVIDWAMQQAETGQLGTVDPAKIATWWRERKPVTKALEPPLIESEKLEPLLSQEQQPLVHLSPAKLDQELTGMLEQHNKEDEGIE